METKLQKGKLGELAAKDYLDEVFGYFDILQYVDDCTYNQEYQDKDIDFMLRHIKYDKINPISIEIKTDYTMGRTDNIFIELSQIRNTGKYDGWFYKCKSDYMMYITDYYIDDNINNYGDFYLFNFKELKRKIEEKEITFEKQTKYNNEDNCKTECYLVPTKDLSKYVTTYHGNLRKYYYKYDYDYTVNTITNYSNEMANGCNAKREEYLMFELNRLQDRAYILIDKAIELKTNNKKGQTKEELNILKKIITIDN